MTTHPCSEISQGSTAFHKRPCLNGWSWYITKVLFPSRGGVTPITGSPAPSCIHSAMRKTFFKQLKAWYAAPAAYPWNSCGRDGTPMRCAVVGPVLMVPIRSARCALFARGSHSEVSAAWGHCPVPLSVMQEVRNEAVRASGQERSESFSVRLAAALFRVPTRPNTFPYGLLIGSIWR